MLKSDIIIKVLLENIFNQFVESAWYSIKAIREKSLFPTQLPTVVAPEFKVTFGVAAESRHSERPLNYKLFLQP